MSIVLYVSYFDWWIVVQRHAGNTSAVLINTRKESDFLLSLPVLTSMAGISAVLIDEVMREIP